MIIGVTDNRANEEKYLLYEAWLRSGPARPEIARLIPGESDEPSAARLDALVLTGGGDVDPSLYGGSPTHPTLSEVSRERDLFESELLRAALARGIPVLGICRGMQLANVVLGGTLVTDLEEAGFPPHRTVEGVKCRHQVSLEGSSALARRLGVQSGEVLSSHHQAVERIAPGLVVAARSGDGVIEALELPGERGGPRAMLVQWHPERMSGSPRSAGLRDFFHTMIAAA